MKKYGIGSTSIFLVCFALLFSKDIRHFGNKSLGDILLYKLNLPSYKINPNGTLGFHYTAFISFVILIFALLLSIKFSKHKYAKESGIIASALLLLYTFLLIENIFI